MNSAFKRSVNILIVVFKFVVTYCKVFAVKIGEVKRLEVNKVLECYDLEGDVIRSYTRRRPLQHAATRVGLVAQLLVKGEQLEQ